MPTGVYVRTEEARRNIGLSSKGRKQTEETRQKISIAPKKIRAKGEEFHPSWVGDSVSYSALHTWVKKHLGTPGTCENCSESNLSGAYINWANISGDYKRDLSDWARLCRRCHSLFDGNNGWKVYNERRKEANV